ncbi:hypothetical protein SLE2022_372440 [Rubroshorea leprosula]
MGVKNLWDILEPCKKTLPLHHLQNKRVCIDLSCWMVQLQNVYKSHCPTKDKLYLKGLFHRLRALIALNCNIIFVADGSIPAIKLSTYRQRLNLGCEVFQDETNSLKVTSLRRNMGSVFSCMIKEAKFLGLALGIPCLDGVEEAEAQCALLNSELLCDGCFSSDSDIFLFGARAVYRDICLGEGGHIVCYEMADIERKLGFGRNSLISLALLLGGDYSQGVHGLGPESACHIVKSVGDNDILQKLASEGVSFARRTKNSKKQDLLAYNQDINGSNGYLQSGNQFLQVIEAYMKPKCHSADSDVVHKVLAQHPFQRLELQQICGKFLEWPPEKTDEYILPKIAERDLRRFANLRATSSGLGVKLSLKEIPVKCPVSAIIKRRKVQGKDCFEVSWEEIDGLKTSIVPADLVESACPEKIVEFEQRRALGKKQKQRKSRPKKSESKTSMAAIDKKLQDLLLDIELGSNPIPIPSRADVADNITPAAVFNFKNQGPLVGLDMEEEEDSVDRRVTMSCQPSCPSVQQDEVIDLLSPSPVHSRYASRFPEVNDQKINVIDLSDSEMDISPEHERKARELRSFLAKIHDELH